jgi:DNA-binding MarR family transcriptional regulator
MPPYRKLLTLPASQYYEKHLSILNVILPVKITPKEIEVLSRFMSFETSNGNRFGSRARKKVKESLNLSDAGLSGHIDNLKTKGFIVKNPNNALRDIINPMLIPDPNQQDYQFRLVAEPDSNIVSTEV